MGSNLAYVEFGINCIHEITSLVSKDFLIKDDSKGLNILAVELVAVILIFNIPRLINSVMMGVLAGDHGVFGGAIGRAASLFTGGVAGAVVGGAVTGAAAKTIHVVSGATANLRSNQNILRRSEASNEK